MLSEAVGQRCSSRSCGTSAAQSKNPSPVSFLVIFGTSEENSAREHGVDTDKSIGEE